MIPLHVAPEVLRDHLERTGVVVSQEPGAIALLALGSCGADLHRLDVWSDLDFFLLAEPQAVSALIEAPHWLDRCGDLVWRHRNTADGWKALYRSGVFVECAVFSVDRLAGIGWDGGRLIWTRADFDPGSIPAPASGGPPDPAWHGAEALGCLLIGLKRFRRGEHLAARRLIQGEALDHLLRIQGANAPDRDRFNPARRAEAVMDGAWLDRVVTSPPDVAAGLILSALEPLCDDAAAMGRAVRAALRQP